MARGALQLCRARLLSLAVEAVALDLIVEGIILQTAEQAVSRLLFLAIVQAVRGPTLSSRNKVSEGAIRRLTVRCRYEKLLVVRGDATALSALRTRGRLVLRACLILLL